MPSKILSKFELSRWLEDWFDDPRAVFRGMFGGLTVYWEGRQVLFLCEDPHQTHYKDTDYHFPIWNGVLLPTEREHHASLKEQYPSLQNHVVLPKWLYLPLSAEDFDEVFPQFIKKIERLDPRFGIQPKARKTKKKSRPRKT